MLSIFTVSGMEDGAKRAVARGKEGAFWGTWRMRLFGGAVGALVALAGALYYRLNGNNDLATILLFSAPFLIFLEPFSHYGALLMGRKEFGKVTTYSVIIQLLSAVAMLTTTIVSSEVIVLILVYLATNVLLRGFFFFRSTRESPPNDVPDPEAIPFGAHISAFPFSRTRPACRLCFRPRTHR
jgi:O-antigen/teichoic acid export membrane protein